MGEATNSSPGRATRLKKNSHSRGASFFDRLDEARLRRQVALSAKGVTANAETKPSVSRNASGIVEPVAEKPAIHEEMRILAEAPLFHGTKLPADQYVVAGGVAEGPWRLVGPGITGGFVFAMIIVIWGEAQIALMTSNTVIGDAAITETALLPGAITGLSQSALPAIDAALTPSVVADTLALVHVPGVANSTSLMPPVPVAFTAFDRTPKALLPPPRPYTGTLMVLNKVPPARPRALGQNTAPTPVFSGIQIVLHIPNGARASTTEALLSAAGGAGFEIAEIQPASFAISRTNIRYFHPQDAQAARVLAQAVGGRFRDFTNFTPPPDPGVIEIWIEGPGIPPRTN